LEFNYINAKFIKNKSRVHGAYASVKPASKNRGKKWVHPKAAFWLSS